MKVSSKCKGTLLTVGGVLMLAGILLNLFLKTFAPWVYGVGVLLYTSIQMRQRYNSDNFTLQRLRRIMILSDVLLILVAALMFADYGNPFGLDHLTWLNYVHNNWVVVLLIAALLQLYTAYRMDAELQKEAKKR